MRILIAVLLSMIIFSCTSGERKRIKFNKKQQLSILQQIYDTEHLVPVEENEKKDKYLDEQHDKPEFIAGKIICKSLNDMDNPVYRRGFYIKEIFTGRFVDSKAEQVIVHARETNTSHGGGGVCRAYLAVVDIKAMKVLHDYYVMGDGNIELNFITKNGFDYIVYTEYVVYQGISDCTQFVYAPYKRTAFGCGVECYKNVIDPQIIKKINEFAK